jgi:hypothetical protein
MALEIGAIRTLVGAAMLAAPVASARVFGADTATARRVTWLTRMMAVRDGALGVGTVGARRAGGGAATWLLAGAVSDGLDAVVLARALAQGRIKGLVPRAIVVAATASAAAGAATAVRIRD